MNPFRLCVFSLVLILVPAAFARADSAALYVTPSSGSYSVGDTFEAEIIADTGGAAINAAEADITFNPQALAVVSVSTDGSILDSWPTQPNFSNDNGTVNFSGVANNKFTGSSGLLITITFKALQNMDTGVHFESGAILAADGVESNIITTMRPGLYTVAPVEVAPQADADSSSTSDSGVADSPGAVASSSVGAASSDVQSPVLLNYQHQVSAGDRIVVSGTAAPNSTVSVYLQQGSGEALRTDMDTDSNGTFTYVSDTEAQEGVYYLWAIAQGHAGEESAPSNKLIITAISSSAASVALFQAAFMQHIVAFATLITFAGLATGFLFHRHRLERYRLELQHKA